LTVNIFGNNIGAHCQLCSHSGCPDSEEKNI